MRQLSAVARVVRKTVQMIRVLSVLVALALLALPAAATAQAPTTNAPPGNSAIDEYLETVPGATGNTRTRPPGGSGGSGNDALTAAERARLERLGPDGKALADAVDATAPSKDAATPKPTATALPAQGRSPVSGVLDTVTGTDGDGMGMLLPAILLATVLGAIALVVVRRRSVS